MIPLNAFSLKMSSYFFCVHFQCTLMLWDCQAHTGLCGTNDTDRLGVTFWVYFDIHYSIFAFQY
jgi:hypothetical protein